MDILSLSQAPFAETPSKGLWHYALEFRSWKTRHSAWDRVPLVERVCSPNSESHFTPNPLTPPNPTLSWKEKRSVSLGHLPVLSVNEYLSLWINKMHYTVATDRTAGLLRTVKKHLEREMEKMNPRLFHVQFPQKLKRKRHLLFDLGMRFIFISERKEPGRSKYKW